MSKDENIAWWLNEEIVKGYITSLYDGIEGSTENAMTPLSIQLPDFQAANMPRGTATKIAIESVKNAKDNVGAMRCPINWLTGRFENIDTPRSP